MSGAGFILAINLFLAGFLSAAFMAVAAYDRRRAAARWMSASYLFGMAYVALEFITPHFDRATPVVVAAFSAFLAATIAFNAGLAKKYDGRLPGWKGAVFFVGASVAVYLVQDLPRDSLTRMMVYQAPYAAMQVVGLWIIVSSRSRREWLDWSLAGLLGASALQFISKPFIAMAVGGAGDNPQAYLDSVYAMISQSMGSVIAFSVAITVLVILVRDVMAEAMAKSESDTLSGLLNRGGFEVRAALAIVDAQRPGVPVSLVIADLDHFKSINDTFGHACGDRVIVAFAQFLRSAMAAHHVAGRIGGEEFAILLPGTNLVAARLFAEGARSSFSSLAIEGLPATKRFTASFGVAERAGNETVSELMMRADKALYTAKNSGRDCVKIAPRPDQRRDDLGTAIRLS